MKPNNRLASQQVTEFPVIVEIQKEVVQEKLRHVKPCKVLVPKEKLKYLSNKSQQDGKNKKVKVRPLNTV